MLELIFLGHFISDFLCQSRWVARNKSVRADALLFHVVVQTLVVSLAVAPFVGLSTYLWFLLLNFLSHGVIDVFSAWATTHFYREENWYGFFSTIGLDQYAHALFYLLFYRHFI